MLVLVDLMRKRVPAEVREYFFDKWMNITSPEIFMEKLDKYEKIREFIRKPTQSLATGRSERNLGTGERSQPHTHPHL